ncbi:unnamed protein product [Macrosiphum euphorbiae]|uniref:Uncharacterized protein n=1 Tax=Macrosiphum euphorbiae TaxID=13131 RepID=A0AAV0XDG7_9HEMI|nr:unnamed protein product [Macrosiphum euphorbiae]
MTRPNEPVTNVLIPSKSSRAAVFVGFYFHFSSKSSLAWSRNSLTLSAESIFLLAVAALPIAFAFLPSRAPNERVVIITNVVQLISVRCAERPLHGQRYILIRNRLYTVGLNLKSNK